MFRTYASKAAAVVAALTLAATIVVITPAQAAQVTLNDSTCDSFTLTGNAPNQVLNCIVSNAPSGCTIQGPATGTINTPITLTAQCANGVAHLWSWAGGNCQGATTQSCQANSATAGLVGYSVALANSIGSGNIASLILTWSNTPSAAPSGCTLSGTPVGATGGPTTLAASCTGGGAPTSFAWTASPAPPAGYATTTSTATQAPTIASTTNFTVTPSNASGGGNQASTVVTVGGGGGGGGGGISCPGFTGTTVIEMDWNNPQRMFTGPLNNGDAVVVHFTTGSTNTQFSSILGSNYGTVETPRVGILSSTACDFNTPPALGWVAASYSSVPYVPFQVGGDGAAMAGLMPNRSYYFNVKTTGFCDSCNMDFDLRR